MRHAPSTRSVVVVGAMVALLVIGAGERPRLVARTVALTFDDLPYVDADVGHDLAAAQRATARTLDVLARHHAPAIGFVNEAKLQVPGEVVARTSLLQAWVTAGLTLGNHTFSHMDYDTVSIDTYNRDIFKGDLVTRRLMQPRRPYQLYFRSPKTHTGDTRAKRDALLGTLAAHHYTLAPHTVENQDFVFNQAYHGALDNHDSAGADRVLRAYLVFTDTTVAFAERISVAIFGREVPQTLLLHVNDLNAACLGELVTRLERRGYRMVSLDEAMADAAYQTIDTTVTRFGPTWLWRWMKSKGMRVSFADEPEPPDWIVTAAARHSPR